MEYYAELFLFHQLHATDLFLYSLKSSENQTFSAVFRGYRKRPWNDMGQAKRELNETEYSRMSQVRFFKGCLPRILLSPFLTTSSQCV